MNIPTVTIPRHLLIQLITATENILDYGMKDEEKDFAEAKEYAEQHGEEQGAHIYTSFVDAQEAVQKIIKLI